MAGLQIRRTARILLVLGSLVWAAGSEARDQHDLDALDAEISELSRAGRFAEALPLAEQLAADSKERFGETSAAYASALSTLATTYFAQSRFDEAEPLYQRTLAIREKVLGPHHEDVRATLDMLASVYLTTRRPELAAPLLDRVLAETEQAAKPDQAAVADALKRLAQAEVALNRYDDAEAHVRRALGIAQSLPDETTRTAALLGALAAVARGRGRLDEAMETLGRALTLHESLAKSGEPEPLAQAAHMQTVVQMAALAQQMNRFDIADAMTERVLALSEAMLGPDHPTVASALEAVASVYERRGQLAEAEAPRKRAIAINEHAYGATSVNVASSLDGLGHLYVLQFRYEEATPLLERGLQRAEAALGPENPALIDHLYNLAEVYFLDRRFDDAESALRRALANLDKAEGLDPVQSATQSVRILRQLAFVCEAQGRPQEARPYLERALAASERTLGPSHALTGTVLSALAVHAWAENRLDEAERLFERALPISEQAGHDSRNHADNLAGLGLVASTRGNWAKAHDAMTAATAIYLALEQRAAGGAAIGPRTSETRSIHQDQFYLMQAVAAYRVATLEPARAKALGDEAFQLAQRTQSSQAAAALSQMAARFASGTSTLAARVRERQDLVGEWRAADTVLTAALALPPDKRDPAAEETLRAHITDTASRIAVIDAKLATDFPEYAALTDPQPLSIEAAQDRLAADETLIFVASLPTESLAWAIGRGAAQFVLLPLGTDQLAREVAALRCGLDSAAWASDGGSSCRSLGLSRTAGAPLPFDLGRAHALYETLLSPFKGLIEGKKLIVAAVGPLSGLPFSVLVTEPPTEAIPTSAGGYKNAAWLVRSHAVSTVPSVASLAALRLTAKSSGASKVFIGFGNPLIAGRDGTDRSAWARQTCKNETALASRSIARLPVQGDLGKVSRATLADTRILRAQNPLPETADELCAVAHDLAASDSDVHLGAEATESAIKELNRSETLANYRVVHFATHGLLPGDTESVGGGTEPSLLLTPPDTASEADDGLLTASEVAQLKLDADWVVLSACNTASGGKGGAEALSGLARAFFYAGARALLVSHWYVDSDAAVKLVTWSFAELKRDPAIGRAEALRRAMVALISDTSRPPQWTPAAHPSVWAPFVVAGEGGAAP